MKYSAPALLTLWLLLFSTEIAYANGIPAIFGTTVFHLVCINALVMSFETSMLKGLTGKKVNAWFIILANLASIILAYILTDKTIAATLHTEWFGLHSKGVIPKKFFIAGITAFILFTILIEWPFFYLAQKQNKKWLVSLKYTAVINLATNIPIALYYLLTGNYYETNE